MDAYKNNRVIVGGCPIFEDYFGLPYLDQGKEYLDGYHDRPLKKVGVGHEVFCRAIVQEVSCV